MKGKKIARIMSIALAAVLLAGCSGNKSEISQESVKKQEKTEVLENKSGVIQWNGDEFWEKAQSITNDKNTLNVFTTNDYSAASMEKLNDLLKNNGFDFQVQMYQIPDGWTDDGKIISFAKKVKEQQIQADIIPMYYQDYKLAAQKKLLAKADTMFQGENGKQLLQALPEKFKTLTQVNGSYYGVGNIEPNAGNYLLADTQELQKYGIQKSELKVPIYKLDFVLKKLSGQEEKAVIALPTESITMFLDYTYVDESLPIGFWEEDGQATVSNLFDSQQFLDVAKATNRYYKNKWVVTDSQSASDSVPVQLDMDGYPSYTGKAPVQTGDGTEKFWEKILYSDTNTKQMSSVYMDTVLASSNRKEQAFSFLQFIFSNKEASELLRYGSSGEYTVTDGFASFSSDSEKTFASTYKEYGNRLLTTPYLNRETKDQKKQADQILNSMKDSKLYGFSFDSSKVQKQVEDVQTVYQEISYLRDIFFFQPKDSSDTRTWKSCYRDYLKKLKEAGIDDIIAEMNRQIQEYIQNGN